MRKQAAFKQLQRFQGEMWLKRIKIAGFYSGGTSGLLLLLLPGSVCLIQESSSGFWHDYDVVGKSSNRAKSGHNPGGEENAEVGVISASCVRQPCNSTADCKLQRCEAGRREAGRVITIRANAASDNWVEICATAGMLPPTARCCSAENTKAPSPRLPPTPLVKVTPASSGWPFGLLCVGNMAEVLVQFSPVIIFTCRIKISMTLVVSALACR